MFTLTNYLHLKTHQNQPSTVVTFRLPKMSPIPKDINTSAHPFSNGTVLIILILLFLLLTCVSAYTTLRPKSHVITAWWTSFLRRHDFREDLRGEIAGTFNPFLLIRATTKLHAQTISHFCTKPAS